MTIDQWQATTEQLPAPGRRVRVALVLEAECVRYYDEKRKEYVFGRVFNGEVYPLACGSDLTHWAYID